MYDTIRYDTIRYHARRSWVAVDGRNVTYVGIPTYGIVPVVPVLYYVARVCDRDACDMVRRAPFNPGIAIYLLRYHSISSSLGLQISTVMIDSFCSIALLFNTIYSKQYRYTNATVNQIHRTTFLGTPPY